MTHIGQQTGKWEGFVWLILYKAIPETPHHSYLLTVVLYEEMKPKMFVHLFNKQFLPLR